MIPKIRYKKNDKMNNPGAVYFSLELCENVVFVKAHGIDGYDWYVIEISEAGIHRCQGISDEAGIPTYEGGSVKEY
jgi:hypothetical protein